MFIIYFLKKKKRYFKREEGGRKDRRRESASSQTKLPNPRILASGAEMCNGYFRVLLLVLFLGKLGERLHEFPIELGDFLVVAVCEDGKADRSGERSRARLAAVQCSADLEFTWVSSA